MGFKDVSNTYCGLVTVEHGVAAPILIELPMEVNVDNCRSFRDVRYLDINGDGNLDVAASTNLEPSVMESRICMDLAFA